MTIVQKPETFPTHPSSSRAPKIRDGEVQNTMWSSGSLSVVDLERVGYYISKPYAAPKEATWTVSWRPLAPYGRPLPRNRESDSGYSTGNVDMAGNQLFLEFDGDLGAIDDNQIVIDRSGGGLDATAIRFGDLARVPAVFGQGVRFDSEDRFDIPSAKLNWGTSDFTWSFFAKSAACTGNELWMGGLTARASEVWIGCRIDASCPLGTGLTALVRGNQTSGAQRCANDRFDDGFWHHIALIKRGHPLVTTELYLDGELVLTNNVAFLDFEEVGFDGTTPFSIGSVRGFGAAGVIDAVAIWARALRPEEIAAIHDRGLLQVRLEIRACDDANCTGAQDWNAQINTRDGGYRDTFDGTGVARATFSRDSQFIQYRMRLDGSGNRSPKIEELIVTYDAN